MSDSAPARRRTLFAILRIAFSVALLAWVLSRADLAAVGAALRGADRRWIVAVLLFFPVGTLMTAVRWRYLLAAQGHRLPLGRLFRACLGAVFAKQLLPSTLGADLTRAHASWRAGTGKAVAVGTLFIERVLGVLMLGLTALAALAFSPDLREAHPVLGRAVLIGAVIPAGAIALLFLQPPALTRWAAAAGARLPGVVGKGVDALLAMAAVFRGRWTLLAGALGYSALVVLQAVVFYGLIGRSLSLPVPGPDYGLIVPVALFAMLLPISINGIGVRESVFVLLLGRYGVTEPTALAFAWIEYGSFLVWAAVGGLVLAMPDRE